jgi:broad specificity phosphatase PhoE
VLRIILIRHGHTAWNAAQGQDPRFRGIIDLPLADSGVEQARTTAQRLAGIPLAAVYTSPLQRAVHTAQIIAQPHGLVAHPLAGLSSMNYGDWAGQSTAHVARHWPDLYRQWCHDPFTIQIPGGELLSDLRGRAMAVLNETLARHTDGETIALVTHQVVTKTLTCALVSLPDAAFWRVSQDLCNLTRFDYEPADRTFTILGLNDTCHLQPMLPNARHGDTRIILVRHGQTAWNEGAGEERFRGRMDLPLDATGHAQAAALAARLNRESIAALYTSPLLRARQTIEPLAAQRSLPLQTHAHLLDIDYGRFQGLTHSEANTLHPERYSLWHTAPSQVHFPGGERLADVEMRLRALLDELLLRHPGDTIILVGHQIVNKVLACTLLGLDLDQIWHIHQDTAGINVFQQVTGQWRTLCLNDTCHLSLSKNHPV